MRRPSPSRDEAPNGPFRNRWRALALVLTLAGLAAALSATRMATLPEPALAAPGDYNRATLSGVEGEPLVGPNYFTFDAVNAEISGQVLTATFTNPGSPLWTLTVQPRTGRLLAEGEQLEVRKNPSSQFAGLNLARDGQQCDEIYAIYDIRRFENEMTTGLSFGMDFNLRCNQPDAPVVSGFVAYRLARGPLDEAAIEPGDLIPVSPTRVLDTRDGSGPLGPNGERTVDVTPSGVVPDSGVLSVVANVTAVNPTQPGYLTVYPAGTSPRPTASNLNFRPGQIVPNLVIVRVGTTGADVGRANVYNYQGDTDVVIDVVGYFAPSADAGGARFRPQQPVRLYDSREGGTPFQPNEVRDLQVAPAGTVAAVLNLTVDRTVGPGFVTVYPADLAARPLASNLNWAPGETVPNLVAVKLSPGGAVKLTTNGNTDLIVDLVGTFVADEANPTGRFVPVDPQRLVDTPGAVGRRAARR